MPAAQIGYRQARFGFAQETNDLLFCKSLFHVQSPVYGIGLQSQTLLKSGGTSVPPGKVSEAPTFSLEGELYRLMFIQLWDQMEPVKRQELVEKLDSGGALKDKVAIAALGGAAALSALSATVAFSGFAFYTSMSIAIASAAGVIGVTLPFATYVGASTIVGVLAGPVGWAITALSALGGLALAGRANLQKTSALICQLHALKVEALVETGFPENHVF